MLTLQNFLFPEPGVCTEHDLYFRPEGEFGYSDRKKHVWLDLGSVIRLNTYFNLFSLGKWAEACALETLYAEIRGEGRVEIRAFHALPGASWEIMYCDIADLVPDSPHLLDLSLFKKRASQGVIYLEIKALDASGARFDGGRFATKDTPLTWPSLAVSITTFRREIEVRETVTRLQAFLSTFDRGDKIRVQVVDNGQSAEIQPSDHVVPFDNPNYGGAGGFARGLIEAQDAGCSHVLFMDDDASFHMENIARAYMFLALAKDPSTAVSGAMITNSHKWAMWENGAWFDGSCHPLYCGLDLRDPGAVIQMEFDSARTRRATDYGGWWFFAFAIAQAKYHPFPFFVRGDDISFSLMNDFRIYTLNGVVSFQDDFTEKESALTLYLDLRNHLIHHLVSDDLTRTPFGTAKIALRFMLRSLGRFHYGSAEAQLLAWRDVMCGPRFFAENVDMAERRAHIKTLMSDEQWVDVATLETTERRRLTNWRPGRRRWLGLLTINGHLMPFSSRRWDRIVLPINERAAGHFAFGASQITYLNTAQDKGYTVQQSKRRFFTIARNTFETLRQFLRDHDRLKAEYREEYAQLASRTFWESKAKDAA